MRYYYSSLPMCNDIHHTLPVLLNSLVAAIQIPYNNNYPY